MLLLVLAIGCTTTLTQVVMLTWLTKLACLSFQLLSVNVVFHFKQSEDVLERTLQLAIANGNRTSLYESLRTSGATTLVENLQSQLKMREGEITQLQV